MLFRSGQSTQVIVGADSSSDANIIQSADTLYRSYGLRRIYYSAFSPIAHSSSRLPNKAPPLMREHRLYQADWLLRYYGFSTPEIVSSMPQGNLDLRIDPKTTISDAMVLCHTRDPQWHQRMRQTFRAAGLPDERN